MGLIPGITKIKKYIKIIFIIHKRELEKDDTLVFPVTDK